MNGDVKIDIEIEQILKHFESETKDFDASINMGGWILAETARKVDIQNLPNKGQPIALSDAKEEWYKLLKDVHEQWHYERLIANHDLAIHEYRPRTFFSFLPKPHAWEKVDNRQSPIEVKQRHFAYRQPRDWGRKGLVSILLPICEGYRRSFRALACLHFDSDSLVAEGFAVEYHVCVNFSDDNSLNEVIRFARTLARSRSSPITVYSMELKERSGNAGSNGWTKTAALNQMLAQVDANRGTVPPEKHFLHFADDDIYIKPGTHIIQGNIKDLEVHSNSKNGRDVSLISAVYTSEEASGFRAVSTVRKRKEWFKNNSERKLLNLYGGCTTTSIKKIKMLLGALRLPESNSEGDFSEDAFLTVKANFQSGEFPEHEQNWNAYADCSRTVGHPEPPNVVTYIQRVARDMKWGPGAIAEVISDPTDPYFYEKNSFSSIRGKSFAFISDDIADKKTTIKDKLAYLWQSKLRAWIKDEVAKPVSKRLPLVTVPRSPKTLNWNKRKTQHQVLLEVVENDALRKNVKSLISDFEKTIDKECSDRCIILSDTEDGSQQVYEICKFLSQFDLTKELESLLVKNKHLFHLYYIAKECVNSIREFESLDHCNVPGGELENSASNTSQKPSQSNNVFVSILEKLVRGEKFELQKSAATCSATFKGRFPVSCSLNKPFFVRYFPVIGLANVIDESPRRLVYLHVLGEEIITASLKIAKSKENKIECEDFESNDPDNEAYDRFNIPSVSIVNTVYPTLNNALINYAGPERSSRKARLQDSIYIQDRLPGNTKPLSSAVLNDRQMLQLASGMGNFLGRLHGVTLGIRSLIENHLKTDIEPWPFDTSLPESALAELILENANQIRLITPNSYDRWLKNSLREKSVSDGQIKDQLIEKFVESEPKSDSIFGRATELVKQDGINIKDIWKSLRSDSVRFHGEFGAVAHCGILLENVEITHDFKKTQNVVQINLSRFLGVAMLDPAIEAGRVLANLFSTRIQFENKDIKNNEIDSIPLQDNSLPEIRETFCAHYRDRLSYHIRSNVFFKNSWGFNNHGNVDEIINAIMTRKSQIAGIALLARFGHLKAAEDFLDPRLRMCVDLMHAGSTEDLRYRDETFYSW